MDLTEPDREEMKVLAAKLATRIPDKTVRQQAALIAEGRLPHDTMRYHFNRVARAVIRSKTARIDKGTRAEVMEWLAVWGTSLNQSEPLGAKRLEMRLTVDQADTIKRAAAKAGLSMADYARRATLLAAERTLGGG